MGAGLRTFAGVGADDVDDMGGVDITAVVDVVVRVGMVLAGGPVVSLADIATAAANSSKCKNEWLLWLGSTQ